MNKKKILEIECWQKKILKCATIIHLRITWVTLFGSCRTKSCIDSFWLGYANSCRYTIIARSCSCCCHKSILRISGEYFFFLSHFFFTFRMGFSWIFFSFLWYWLDIVIINNINKIYIHKTEHGQRIESINMTKLIFPSFLVSFRMR